MIVLADTEGTGFMKNLLAIFIVLVVYTCALFVNAPELIHITVLVEILVNFVLHFTLSAKNKIHLAALPAAWALCCIPLCYFVFRFPWLGNFPILEKFIFMVYGGVTVLPIFVISSLTSAVSYCRRRYRMSKSGGFSNNG